MKQSNKRWLKFFFVLIGSFLIEMLCCFLLFVAEVRDIAWVIAVFLGGPLGCIVLLYFFDRSFYDIQKFSLIGAVLGWCLACPIVILAVFLLVTLVPEDISFYIERYFFLPLQVVSVLLSWSGYNLGRMISSRLTGETREKESK